MPLEIVPGSEVQTQVGAAKINAQDFRAAALAKGSVIAGAGEDVAKLFNEVSTKLQDIRNTKHVVDADNAINQFNQQAQENVLKEPKPEGWSQSYNAQFKAFQDQYMAEHPEFGPEVRNHVQNMLERSKVATDINIRTAANKRLLSDTADAVETGMSRDVNSLPRDAATAKYMNGLMLLKEKGILDDTQYNIRVQQAPKVIDMGQFKQGVTTDPIHTWLSLQEKDSKGNYTNYTSLTGEDRDKVLTEARAKASEKQVNNGDKIQNEIRQTPGYLVDRKKIQQYANNNEITQRRADGIINSFRTQDARMEQAMFDQMKAQVVTHDFKNDLWPSLFIGKMKDNASGLSPKLQTEFITFIDGYHKKESQPQVTQDNIVAAALKKEMLANYSQSEKNDLFNIPMVLSTKKEIVQKNKFWADVTKDIPILAEYKDKEQEVTIDKLKSSPELVEKYYGKGVKWDDVTFAVNKKRSSDIAAIENFFDPKNPNRLDPTENTKFLNTIKSKWALEQTVSALKGMTMPKVETEKPKEKDRVVITSEQEFNNLEKGTPFIYNGKKGVKN